MEATIQNNELKVNEVCKVVYAIAKKGRRKGQVVKFGAFKDSNFSSLLVDMLLKAGCEVDDYTNSGDE